MGKTKNVSVESWEALNCKGGGAFHHGVGEVCVAVGVGGGTATHLKRGKKPTLSLLPQGSLWGADLSSHIPITDKASV